MSESGHIPKSDSSTAPALTALLTRLLADQRQAHHENRPRSVENYLEEYPTLRSKDNAILDLIYQEILLREERGAPASLEEYQQRFPNLSAELQVLFEIDRALEMPTGSFAESQVLTETFGTSPVESEETPTPSELSGYEILGELGRGGMGVVYKAKQIALGRVVALKMVLGHADREEVSRFQIEAEAVARLQHPNIVQIHEVGQYAGKPFFSLEYCAGGTLRQKLRNNVLSGAEAAVLLETLARAIHEAHLVHVIHRDLKPANVLLTHDGVPKITDFGLAKKLDDEGQTQSGAIMGTPSYMAPEQAAGKLPEIGPASDVYALGAILYECLTGRPPFKSATVMDTLMQVINEEPVSPKQLNPKIPLDLETICLKCLQKDRHKRYANAASLADDLRRYTRGEPIHARAVSRTEKLWRLCRRNPGVSSLLALVLLVLSAGVAISTYFALKGEAKAADERTLRGEYEIVAEKETKLRKEAESFAERQQRLRKEADFQRDTAKASAYSSQLLLVQQALDAGLVSQARANLTKTDPALRGWEHDHLQRQCMRNVATWADHSEPVLSASWSRDGAHIASGSKDKTIRIRDAGTGEELHVLEGHTDRVAAVEWSPDGNRLASGSWDTTLKLWDAKSGALSETITDQLGSVQSLAWSPDGTRLASGCVDKTVKVWDSRSKELLQTFTGAKGTVNGLCWSPDGKQLAGIDDSGWLNVWDEKTGKNLLARDGKGFQAWDLDWSPDGTRIVIGNVRLSATEIIDAKTGRTLQTLRGHMGRVYSVVWSPDGSRILTGGDIGEIRVWDDRTGQAMLVIFGHRGRVNEVSWNPDGTHIVAGGDDNLVKVWDVRENRDPRILRGHRSGITGIDWNSDSTQIVSGSVDRMLLFWDTKTGQIAKRIQTSHVGAMTVDWSPDNSRVVSGGGFDRTAQVWDVETGKSLLTYKEHSDKVNAVHWSPDGRSIASASADKTVRVWDATTGETLHTLDKFDKDVFAVSWSPDGTQIVSGTSPEDLRIWDTTTGQVVRTLEGQQGSISCLAWSPDGSRIVTGGSDKLLQLWDAHTGKQLLTMTGHTTLIRSLAWSPDGTRVVSGSDQGEGNMRVWDAHTGQALLTLKRQESTARNDGVYALGWSPDGRSIASGHYVNKVRLWDTTSEK